MNLLRVVSVQEDHVAAEQVLTRSQVASLLEHPSKPRPQGTSPSPRTSRPAPAHASLAPGSKDQFEELAVSQTAGGSAGRSAGAWNESPGRDLGPTESAVPTPNKNSSGHRHPPKVVH